MSMKTLTVDLFARRTALWGVALALAGVAMAGVSVWARSADFRQLVLEMVLISGMAFFSMGLFGIILEMKSWKKYFESGLREIVLQPDFLRKLNPKELIAYQVGVFRTYYGYEDIDKEEGFLRYCLNHIHRYMAEPYREEIRDEIEVTCLDPARIRIRDDLSYVCRPGKEGLQDRLVWQGNAKELLEMESLYVELRPPRKQAGEKRRILLGIDDLEVHEQPDGSVCYEYDLSPYRSMDSLRVQVVATYIAHQAHFNTWRMVVPSREVELSISYPQEYELQLLPFLLDTEPFEQSDDPGSFTIAFNSWVMPKSGFAWKLLPRGVVVRVDANATAQQDLEEEGLEDISKRFLPPAAAAMASAG